MPAWRRLVQGNDEKIVAKRAAVPVYTVPVTAERAM
jgi:hypothetical protein